MTVRLSELVSLLPEARLVGDAAIVDLTHDSRRVEPGFLFCALPGRHQDGEAFIDEAHARGATAVLVRRPVDSPLPQLVVPHVRAAIGPIAAAIHGWPARALRTVGITGTDGKTTTAYLLEGALRAAGLSTGLIGTVEVRVGSEAHSSTFTTPEAPDLQRHLAGMVASGTDACVMEVSSHGIDQHRIEGMSFDVAVFTNLSAEHLDYHGTIEHYWATKARLFEPERSRLGVVGTDGTWGVRLAAQAAIPVVTFARLAPDVGPNGRRLDPLAAPSLGIRRIRTSLEGTTATVVERGHAFELACHLPGLYNAQNMAAAFLAARLLGVDPVDAARGIAACPPVPGRFERVNRGQPFLVVVDYAHTPVALAGLLATVRRLVAGRVLLVVGARGGRDRLKRPETGRVAASADLAFLTTDSPGPEDPARIVAELLAGTLDVPHRNVLVELDRARAIESAISLARRGDAVVVVGRGHETSRHIGEETVAFDDRLVAAAALERLGYDVAPSPGMAALSRAR